jgi:hypothetical protein
VGKTAATAGKNLQSFAGLRDAWIVLEEAESLTERLRKKYSLPEIPQTLPLQNDDQAFLRTDLQTAAPSRAYVGRKWLRARLLRVTPPGSTAFPNGRPT